MSAGSAAFLHLWLEELIVTYEDWNDEDFFMDSRLHILYKSLLCRGVNVVARADGCSEKHLYIATGSGLSLLKKALCPPFYWKPDWYITQSPGLDLSLPLLIEMVLSQVPSLQAQPHHVATNHVKISSDMDMERLKQAMMGGVTSFNIWRDDDEELSEEEKRPINMLLDILEQRKGKLTSVSMPKVDLTDIQISTYR